MALPSHQPVKLPTESYESFVVMSPQEQSSKVAEYHQKGIPFVLTGLNQHPAWKEGTPALSGRSRITDGRQELTLW